ncbi:IclR family transcriptional regulator [Actinosynnema sp. NPDC047251]|uniref:Glycerol operon regulatory protein n=1 Tax=Saccharothrix espanaensis (strain ATCC 51144 / DSM 44229 / JCM 9112 / NBRC 15066 / NRRL 15764) TaxID=1179773 RepID=K0JUZ9_SACES|nr:IclR family transcriptional regulator [Saccharothrix espanaensis]CCH31675.1 Transcriptional regulator, IclR family [Saccharothrix espanaensis DSM 44229]
MATSAAAPGAQAVHRALGVLQCFRHNGPELGVTDIAKAMELPISTAHRLVLALVAAGFLERDPDTARYRLGTTVAELGQLHYLQHGLHKLEPVLDRLARTTKASASISVRSGHDALVLIGGLGGAELSDGVRAPLHTTAMGKVLLAWAPPGEDDLDALPELVRPTDRTIGSRDELRGELDRVRAAGYALNNGESEVGVRSVAVPVLDADGFSYAALTLRATPELITDDRVRWFVDQALARVDRVAALLLPSL